MSVCITVSMLLAAFPAATYATDDNEETQSPQTQVTEETTQEIAQAVEETASGEVGIVAETAETTVEDNAVLEVAEVAEETIVVSSLDELKNAINDAADNVATTIQLSADINCGELTSSDNIDPNDVESSVVAEADGAEYTDLAAALKDADGTVKLLKDVTTAEHVVIDTNNTITLDLNGCKYEYTGEESYAISLKGGYNLTVVDSSTTGEIIAANRVFEVGDNTSTGGGASLTLNGGTVTSKATGAQCVIGIRANTTADHTISVPCKVTVNSAKLNGGVYIFGKGAELTVNEGAVIDVNGYYAISGNGTKNETTNMGDTVININGGTITQVDEGEGGAIYHPQAGVLNITGNPTITGENGIQLCSGVANISGGTITATGTNQSADKEGDGYIPSAEAISVVERDYSGGVPQINITGGRL